MSQEVERHATVRKRAAEPAPYRPAPAARTRCPRDRRRRRRACCRPARCVWAALRQRRSRRAASGADHEGREPSPSWAVVDEVKAALPGVDPEGRDRAAPHGGPEYRRSARGHRRSAHLVLPRSTAYRFRPTVKDLERDAPARQARPDPQPGCSLRVGSSRTGTPPRSRPPDRRRAHRSVGSTTPTTCTAEAPQWSLGRRP